jgi:hypothetical protein
MKINIPRGSEGEEGSRDIQRDAESRRERQRERARLEAVRQRDEDLRRDTDDEKAPTVSLEDVDRAMLHQFKERFDLAVEQNGRRIDVPVIFDKPERWRWAANQDVKALGDKVIYPILVMKRGTSDTDPDLDNPNKGRFTFGLESSGFVARQRYSEQNKFDNFSALTGRKPAYEYFLMQVPKYLDINYDVTILTEYQIQANRLKERIMYQSRSYWGDPDRWLFWCEATGFDSEVEEAEGDTRYVETTFSVDVKGYIIPEESLKRSTLQKKLSVAKTVFEEKIVTEIPD